ncbi:MAG TPA: hypothetical protein VG965_05900, partial [Patescibacteria group bacterium]|nr:hypothetical protein [Patescibacteria group bacterium]
TPSAVSPTVEVEPEVNNWMPYNNDKFNFSINVPDGWKSQDYSSQANGGAQIAFSPNSLPCDTCTYFYDGFFSIKIYNQKTSPDAYADYQQRLAFIGKKEGYQQIKIGAAQGVLAANTVALASQGYIYELSLDEDHGSKNAVDSKIFMNVLSSIKFTGLAF